MKHKILVATDGSEFSEGAVREAINVARTCGGELHCVSVMETYFTHYPDFLNLASTAIEERQKEIRELLDDIKKRASGSNVSCDGVMLQGEETYRAIIEEAEKIQAGLIIAGRHGRKGLMRLLMGSVTARVIGHSPCKVLVVPREAEIRWENVVIATDGSRYSKAAAEETIRLMKQCCAGCQLHAISVVRPDAPEALVRESENALREVKSAAEKENITVDSLLIDNRPQESVHESIVRYAEGKAADFIVMGSHGRTGIQRLLMGSVTDRVIGHAGCAVLVVKA